jgi:hypothetical protein
MCAQLTSADVAGVLDQLYPGAKPTVASSNLSGSAAITDALGVPRRFYISRRYGDLAKFAGRKRSLRADFYAQLSEELTFSYRLIMSEPRVPKAGVLAFASLSLIESWQAVPEEALAAALKTKLEGVWIQAVCARLERLYSLNHGDPDHLKPIVLSEEQFYRVTEKAKSKKEVWSDAINDVSNGLECALVFFLNSLDPERYLVITREDYIRKWRRAVQQDWNAAAKRYTLEEIDEQCRE